MIPPTNNYKMYKNFKLINISRKELYLVDIEIIKHLLGSSMQWVLI